MDGFYSICVTLESLDGLGKEWGSKGQSPTVAFLISPICRWVLSTPATGGQNPWWNQKYTLLCEERDFKDARLTMILFHEGKNYDTILGIVGNIQVSDLPPSSLQRRPVLSKSGMSVGGSLTFFVKVVPPPTLATRSFTLTVHHAQNLKNVKRFWKRISLRGLCVREMKPYVVAKNYRGNEPLWVSPIAGKGGRDPEFNFYKKITRKEIALQQDEVSFTIELHHRHKAEYNRGSSDRDRAKDIMIGFVENIRISQLSRQSRGIPYHVITPEKKFGGNLLVSVALEKPEQEELIPSPYRTSWKPRIRPPNNGVHGVNVDLILKFFGQASRLILLALGF